MGKDRDGRDERVDAGKLWKIAWGELRREGAIWEIALGVLRWEGARQQDGSDERVDGRETVGNSLGRAPVGRSDTGVTTGWTEGKPWEIAWEELRWEGAMRE